MVTRTNPCAGGNKVCVEYFSGSRRDEGYREGRTGYVVETYQVWYKNGEEVSRNLLCTSTYKAYQKTVEYNE